MNGVSNAPKLVNDWLLVWSTRTVQHVCVLQGRRPGVRRSVDGEAFSYMFAPFCIKSDD